MPAGGRAEEISVCAPLVVSQRACAVRFVQVARGRLGASGARRVGVRGKFGEQLSIESSNAASPSVS